LYFQCITLFYEHPFNLAKWLIFILGFHCATGSNSCTDASTYPNAVAYSYANADACTNTNAYTNNVQWESRRIFMHKRIVQRGHLHRHKSGRNMANVMSDSV
jgi:hypothetical protein